MTDINLDIPGYRLIGEIGKGGMATVYLAEQEVFQRQVAVKVLDAQMASSSDFGERFLREARLVANLKHINVVQVFDAGVHNGLYYIAMEHLGGGDLTAPSFSSGQALDPIELSIAVLGALDAAAKLSIVHRDVKPSNIMFREDGTPVLLDFGLARQINTEERVTLVSSLIGTPHYMSPEQFNDEDVDHRSDLYSFGIVLYELLTGDVPFTASSPAAIGVKHLSETMPSLPIRIGAFELPLSKALAKDPVDRYQDASHFALDLMAVRDSLPANAFDVLSVPTASRAGSIKQSVRLSMSPANAVSAVRPAFVQDEEQPKGHQNPLTHRIWWFLTGLAVFAFVSTSALMMWRLIGESTIPVLAPIEQPLPQLATDAAKPSALATAEEAPASVETAEDSAAILYLEQASAALSNREYGLALSFVERGFSTTSDASILYDLDLVGEEARQRLAQAREINKTRLELEDQLGAGNLVTPSDNNAFTIINHLEEIGDETGFVTGKRSEVQDLLKGQISSTLAENNLEAATNLRDRASKHVSQEYIATLTSMINIWELEKKRELKARDDAIAAAYKTTNGVTSVSDAKEALSQWAYVEEKSPNAPEVSQGLESVSKWLHGEIERQISEGNLQEADTALRLLESLDNSLGESLRTTLFEAKSKLRTAEQSLAAADQQILPLVQRLDSGPKLSETERVRAIDTAIGALRLVDDAMYLYPQVNGTSAIATRAMNLLIGLVDGAISARQLRLLNTYMQEQSTKTFKVLKLEPSIGTLAATVAENAARQRASFSTF